MAKIDVIMPQMGESIAEGTLSRWIKKVGDPIKRDEPIFEISTDKVDAEIPAPSAGVLAEILVTEGQTVAVQTVVARIETDAAVGASQPAAPVAAPAAAAPVASAVAAPAAAVPVREKRPTPSTPPPAPSTPAPAAPPGRRPRRNAQPRPGTASPAPPKSVSAVAPRRWCARWWRSTIST